MRWVGHVARMTERRGEYRVLVRWPDGMRPLGRPRRRWEDNIRCIFKKCSDELWTGLIWLRTRKNWRGLVNVVMNIRVP
jgi:hypothetical protein